MNTNGSDAVQPTDYSSYYDMPSMSLFSCYRDGRRATRAFRGQGSNPHKEHTKTFLKKTWPRSIDFQIQKQKSSIDFPTQKSNESHYHLNARKRETKGIRGKDNFLDYLGKAYL